MGIAFVVCFHMLPTVQKPIYTGFFAIVRNVATEKREFGNIIEDCLLWFAKNLLQVACAKGNEGPIGKTSNHT